VLPGQLYNQGSTGNTERIIVASDSVCNVCG
jgi:hypothetical protein